MRTFGQKQQQPQKPVYSSLARPHLATLGPDHLKHSILDLQRTIGNQAVLRLLQTPAEEPDVGVTAAASPRFGHDFSQIPLHPPVAGAIQTKLAINKPGEEYELEADRISAPVMQRPEPQLQRACACGGGYRECRTEQSGQKHERLQTKHAQSSDTEPMAAPPLVHKVLASPGQPLDSATRAFMEPRFRHDFSRVRVHTDPRAVESAGAVKALADTVGRDVVFGQGRDNPRSTEGRQLFAHEQTHVAQQARPDSAGIPLLQRAPEKEKKKPSPEGKKEEQQSKAAGKKVVPSYRDCAPAPAKFEQLEAIRSNIFGHTGLGAVSPLEADILFDNNICKTKVKTAPGFSLKDFIYAKEGDYPRGKETPPHPPCKGKQLDVYVHITPEVSERIRDGEIEHCNDIHRAFDLTFAKYLGVYKALEGGVLASDAQSCQQVVSKIALDVTGIEPSKLANTFLCLFNTSKSRDDEPNRWHTLAWGQPETAKYAKDCKSVTYTPDLKTVLPEIGNHSSEDVVKGCGLKG